MAEADAGAHRICRRCIETCRRLVASDDTPKAPARRTVKFRCSFCNVSQTETAKLIAGPNVYICGDCVVTARDVVVAAVPAKTPRQVVLRPAAGEAGRCHFCGRATPAGAQVVKGGRGRICEECLRLCDDILAEELGDR